MNFYETLDEKQLDGVTILEEFLENDNVDNDKMFLFEGQGGSGKTYSISRLIFKNTETKFIFLCPTHKALSVLKKTIEQFLRTNDIPVSIDFGSSFYTIASFFVKKLFYDKNGNSSFRSVGRIKTKIDEMLNDKNPDDKLCIVVDECSMINYQQFMDFNKLLDMYSFIKIIFIGDRNQLPYIKERGIINNTDIIEEAIDMELPTDIKNTLDKFINYTEFLSPIFTQVPQQYLLKSFKRSDKEDLKEIVFSLKEGVVKNEFNERKFFKMIKESKNATKLSIEKFKKLIKKKKMIKGIAHTNKQKDAYNNIVRKLLYKKHEHYNTYKYVEDDIIIFDTTAIINEFEKFQNNTELKILSSMYDMNINLSFKKLLGFKITYQHMNTVDVETKERHTISQVSLKDEERFVKFCKVIRSFFVKKIRKNNRTGKNIERCFCNICENVIRPKEQKFGTDEVCCLICYNKLQRIYKEECMETKKEGEAYNKLMSEIDSYKYKFNMPCSYAYCITIAKSQGSTFKNVLYIHNTDTFKVERNYKRTMTRNIYTAVSRTSHRLYTMKKFL